MILTRQDRANRAAELWRIQYPSYAWPDSYVKIADKIDALGDNPDPDEVDKIICNGSWTDIRCDVCGKEADAVSVIETKYGSNSIHVCKQCLCDNLAEQVKNK